MHSTGMPKAPSSKRLHLTFDWNCRRRVSEKIDFSGEQGFSLSINVNLTVSFIGTTNRTIKRNDNLPVNKTDPYCRFSKFAVDT